MLFSEKWIFNVTQHWNWCTFCVYHFIFTIFLLSFNRARALSPSLFLSSSRQLVRYLPTRSHFILLENNNSSQILSLKLLNIYLLPSRRPRFNWCVCERGRFFVVVVLLLLICLMQCMHLSFGAVMRHKSANVLLSSLFNFIRLCAPVSPPLLTLVYHTVFFQVSVSNYVFTFCSNCSDISRDFSFSFFFFFHPSINITQDKIILIVFYAWTCLYVQTIYYIPLNWTRQSTQHTTQLLFKIHFS